MGATPDDASPEPGAAVFRPVLLISVEARGSVLLGVGANEGLTIGQGGRLLVGDTIVGRFQITEVYPEGSRAQLARAIDPSLTSDARAEIESPTTP